MYSAFRHLTTVHYFPALPLYLAKRSNNIYALQDGRVLDINVRPIAEASKIFPFGEDFTLGERPSADFAAVDGSQVRFLGGIVEIPDNSMVFGFFAHESLHYCACQRGLVVLESGSLLAFAENALSCDGSADQLAVGFERCVRLFRLTKGKLSIIVEVPAASPVVEVRTGDGILAFKCANNAFECHDTRESRLLMREQFSRPICSLCCVGYRLFVSNVVGEIVVFGR